MSRHPHPSMNRKDWMERYIVCRREREDALREAWKATEKYFKTCDVKAVQYNALSSPETYQLSMNAYQERKGREEEERILGDRRKKLAALLQQEKEQYGLELKALLNRRRHKWYSLPLVNSSASQILSSATPELHHPASDESAIVTDHGTYRSRPASNLESAQHCVDIHDKVADRIQSPVAVVKDSLVENGKLLETLLEDMRRTEQDIVHLKQGQAILQQYLNELQAKVRQRCRLAKQQRRVNWSKMLMRPYKIQIQIRTRDIIESLEFDVRLLDMMLNLVRKADVEDNVCCVDLERLKKQLFQDLSHENCQLLGSESLFQEEAERQWNLRIQQWEEEQLARDSLIEKLVHLVESRLQSQLAINLEKQQENIAVRETLLQNLESFQHRSDGELHHTASGPQRCETSAEMTAESNHRLSQPKDVSLPAIDRLHL